MAIQLSGSLAITGSLTTTGQIIAQTLNVSGSTGLVLSANDSNVLAGAYNTSSSLSMLTVTGSLAAVGANQPNFYWYVSSSVSESISSSVVTDPGALIIRDASTSGTGNPSLILQRGGPSANGDWKIQNSGGSFVISDGWDSTKNSNWRVTSSFSIVAGSGDTPGAATFGSSVTATNLILGDGNNLTWGGAYGANIPTIASLAGAGSYIAFYPGGSSSGEIMRLTNGGNIGISTTSPDPNANLTIAPSGFGVTGSSDTFIHLAGDTTKRRLLMDSTNVNGPVILGRQANGTQTALTATATDNTLLFIDAAGHNGTGYNNFSVAMVFRAAENYTTSSAGSYIAFSTTPTGSITIAEAMRIAPDGNVGIGTVSPTTKLSVVGAGEFSSSVTAQNMYSVSDNSEQITIKTATDNNKQLIFGRTSNDARIIGVTQGVGYCPLLLQPNGGNIGIGTTSPYQNLQVYQTGTSGNNYIEGTIQVGGTSSTLGAALSYAAQNSGYVNLVNLNTSGGANARISLGFGAISSGLPANTVMTLNQSGNVGIGTTAPNAKLDIVSTGAGSEGLRVDGATGGFAFVVRGGDTYTSHIRAGLTVGANYFTTPPTNGVIIEGNVGIGTTSPTGSLEVVGSGSIISRFNSTATNGGVISFQRSGTAILDIGTGLGLLGVGTNNDTAIYSTATMYLGANGTQFVTLRNGNVGIGASSTPVYMLEVSSTGGSQRIRVGTLQNNDNTSRFEAITSNGVSVANSAWLRVNDAGGFTLGQSDYTKTGGDSGNFANLSSEVEIPRITVSSAGNVGIGTTSPSALLELKSSTGTAAFGNGINIFTQAGTYSTGHGGILQFQNEDVITAGIRGVRDPGSWASSMLFYTHNASTGNTFDSTFVERMRINHEGNVGIGTTNPLSRLHVQGSEPNIRIVDSDDSGVMFIGNSGGYSFVRPFSRDFRFLNAAGSSLMAVASGGNVGIGTTSPSEKLDVNGTIKATQLSLGDSYNTTVTTDSSWSSFQTIIPGNTLEVFSVYLITASYSVNDQPYNVTTSFTFVVPNCNGSGGDNEFTPICATHTGGTGTMSFRAFAVGGQLAGGLQIKFNGFANLTGSLKLRATILKRSIG